MFQAWWVHNAFCWSPRSGPPDLANTQAAGALSSQSLQDVEGCVSSSFLIALPNSVRSSISDKSKPRSENILDLEVETFKLQFGYHVSPSVENKRNSGAVTY